MSLALSTLRPVQALAASALYKHRRLLLNLPRQYGGKTELGIRLIHDLTGRPFQSSALFLAKSIKASRKMAREKFMRLFDASKFSVNTEQVYLKDYPSSICFIDSVDKDPDRIRGGTFNLIHWAEVAFSKFELGQTVKDVFDKVLQPTTRLNNGYLFLESTCNGKNGWYDLWENARDFKFSRLKVTFSDLVYLGLVTEQEYEQVRSTTQPDVFQQEYECEFITFLGKTYPEFSIKHHVDFDMPGPAEWQTTLFSIDWGYSPSATAVLFAYMRDGVLHVYDEHYAKEELAMHTAQAIQLKRDTWLMKDLVGVADHEQDRIDELVNRGIPCGKADKVDVLGNRIQIKEMFFQNKIRISARCRNLIRDLESAVWHPKKSDKGELDDSQCTWGHFDAESALRYMVRELSNYREYEPVDFSHLDASASEEWARRRMRLGENYGA